MYEARSARAWTNCINTILRREQRLFLEGIDSQDVDLPLLLHNHATLDVGTKVTGRSIDDGGTSDEFQRVGSGVHLKEGYSMDTSHEEETGRQITNSSKNRTSVVIILEARKGLCLFQLHPFFFAIKHFMKLKSTQTGAAEKS